MQRHGYKGAFELAATVDYLFGYDATAHVVEDWMYERVTDAYVADPEVRKFFERSNPWALRAIVERLLEAHERGLWDASVRRVDTFRRRCSKPRAGRSPVNAMKPARFPFSAVVGQDEAKLALCCSRPSTPAIGGVLLRGQKGSAKTTLARGLAALLPGDAPFVELPLGATEDRLIGTLDLGAALTGEGRRFEPGLLAAAHGGVLYVDEVNLLPDHLVDVLLDVAASGVNRVEREGISHEHPARFVLVGSMNPEEGELRPQLLDRFGLAVEVTTSFDPRDRGRGGAAAASPSTPSPPPCAAARAVEQELEPDSPRPPPALPDALLLGSGCCAPPPAPTGCAPTSSSAAPRPPSPGWSVAPRRRSDDVRRVAPIALAHRQRRTPFDQPRET